MNTAGTTSGRIPSGKPNQANKPKGADGMEKQAVVRTEAEKKAHADLSKKHGQETTEK